MDAETFMEEIIKSEKLWNVKNKIEKLEEKLSLMREDHIKLWEVYGSELCAGEMIKKEDALERKIEKLKKVL